MQNCNLHQKQVDNSYIYMFGLPIKLLPQWLDLTQEEQRDEFIDPNKNKETAGIPIDMNEDLSKPNELPNLDESCLQIYLMIICKVLSKTVRVLP